MFLGNTGLPKCSTLYTHQNIAYIYIYIYIYVCVCVNFIEITRALSSDICQATAFRSRLKNHVNKIR